LSAYFMSKSVFELQGCHALTLALARLSGFKSWLRPRLFVLIFACANVHNE